MILNNEQLDNECHAILENLKSRGFAIYSPIFKLLYLHGFRANELQYYEFWELQPDNFVRFPTSKKGTDRLILLDTLPTTIQDYMLTGQKNFYLTKYSTLDWYFKQASNYRFTVKSKNITTHLFRHNVMRKMHQAGYSRQAIQQKFGLLRIETVDNYINSTIYRHYK